MAAFRQKQRCCSSIAVFPSLDALLRTLLLHVGCGWSLRETSVQAKLAGIAEVSDVTVLNRLRDAENWLRRCVRSCGRTTSSICNRVLERERCAC